MARTESDREDLMEEAVALKQRVEFTLAEASQPIVAGFRIGGEFSIYFGGDPVFHFDSQGRLRRAFADDCLYRTQGSTLARLRRDRAPSETVLARHDLTVTELSLFIDKLRERLVAVQAALAESNLRILRQVPDDDDLIAMLSAKVDEILSSGLPLALAVPGKR